MITLKLDGYEFEIADDLSRILKSPGDCFVVEMQVKEYIGDARRMIEMGSVVGGAASLHLEASALRTLLTRIGAIPGVEWDVRSDVEERVKKRTAEINKEEGDNIVY